LRHDLVTHRESFGPYITGGAIRLCRKGDCHTFAARSRHPPGDPWSLYCRGGYTHLQEGGLSYVYGTISPPTGRSLVLISPGGLHTFAGRVIVIRLRHDLVTHREILGPYITGGLLYAFAGRVIVIRLRHDLATHQKVLAVGGPWSL